MASERFHINIEFLHKTLTCRLFFRVYALATRTRPDEVSRFAFQLLLGFRSPHRAQLAELNYKHLKFRVSEVRNRNMSSTDPARQEQHGKTKISVASTDDGIFKI